MSSGKIVQVIGPVVDVEFSLDQSLPDINNALIVYKKTRKNKSSIGSRFRTRGWCDPHHRNGIYRRFATRNGSHRYRCLNLCPCRNRYSRPVFNVLGDTIDLEAPFPEDAKRSGIHKKPQISMNCQQVQKSLKLGSKLSIY